jgi:CRP-like cAMP-binding protein
LNDKVPIKDEIRLKIESHFDYKWQFDRNQAIDDESEKAMLAQLPE